MTKEKTSQVTHDEALKIAQYHHQTGNLTLAERTYRDILIALPDDVTSLHFLSIICYQQGKFDEGVDFAKQAIDIDGSNPDTWNAYGVMLDQIDKHEEGIKALQEAIKLKPDFAEAYSNMAHASWKAKNYEAAEDAAEQAVKIKPDFADALVNLGAIQAEQDKHDEALATWDRALAINPNHPSVFINLGNILRIKGQVSEAEEKCLRGLELAPNHHEGLLNLGNVYKDQGRYDEAVDTYRKAIAVHPNYVNAHNNLAMTLADQLKYDEAASSARFAIAFDPKNAQAYNTLAVCLRETNQLEDAETAARKALNLKPDSTEAKIELSDILFLSDRLDEAETLLEDAMEEVEPDVKLYIKLSSVLEKANRGDEALEAIDKALEISPEMPDIYHRRASIYFMDNRIEEALDSIHKALELKPNFPYALGTKSEILQSHGDMEGALKTAREGLDINPNLPFLYYTVSKLKKFTEGDEDLQKMEELSEKAKSQGLSQSAALNFALFKAYEDIKDYNKAFEKLKAGNDAKRASVVFKRDMQKLSYDRTKEKYTREWIDSFDGKGCESDAPILIVGMPRSGTTLTEQIISSHPDVFGAGELTYITQVENQMGPQTFENCAAMGQAYIDMVRKIDDDSAKAKKFTDKMPGNYMRLGQMVTTLPNAKIIHCKRNPIDTTLSCYKQLFSRGHYWSYDQEEMVEHYHLYDDMMNYWREIMPEKFLEINYEDTVNDFENQARRLIEYVGLEWHDACLTPHKTKRSVLTASKGQVRKPIYKTSVEAWRRYEEQLQPLVTGLSPLIEK